MHMEALKASGLKGAYTPLEVTPASLESSLAALFELGFDGLNVTVSHKRAVIGRLVSLSEEAEKIGAVNTLLRGPEGFSGFNTDASGFASAYLADISPRARTLLLGAGGAARAVAQALSANNLEAYIACRDKRAADELAASFGHKAATWTEISDLEPLDLAINATSASSPAELGAMAPNLPLAKGALMVDLNYGRPFNHFQDQAAKSEAVFKDGLPMLAHQARFSFKIWTGADPGLGPFWRALTEARNEALSEPQIETWGAAHGLKNLPEDEEAPKSKAGEAEK
jgi:shikimate dehydrogenase